MALPKRVTIPPEQHTDINHHVHDHVLHELHPFTLHSSLLSFKDLKTSLHANFLAVFLSEAVDECLYVTPLASTSIVMVAASFWKDFNGFFIS